MKYRKTVEVEVEITEEDIAEINKIYGEEDDVDYADLDNLENLLDDLVFIPVATAISYLPKRLYEKAKISESSDLVGIKYPD